MGVAAAENYAYNRANGVDPQEALGNAVANGVVEGTIAGLIDQGAKKLVGMCAKPKPEPKLSHPSPKPLPEPELQPLSEAELEKVVGGAKDPNWRPGGAESAGGTKALGLKSDRQLTELKRSELIEAYKDHIFSRDHLSNGIMELGKDKIEIMNKGLDVIDKLLREKRLMEGSTTIIKKINGYASSIRVFVKDGVVLSFNMFKGISGRNGNIIDLLPKG